MTSYQWIVLVSFFTSLDASFDESDGFMTEATGFYEPLHTLILSRYRFLNLSIE